MPLVDHHCHGVVPGDLDRRSFEGFITEGFAPAPEGTSHFDSPVGLAIRRWCAPILELPPLVSPDDYLTRRAELGAEEVHRRLLRSAGLETLLVETGHLAADLLGPAAMGLLAAAPAHEVVRLETVAEAVARDGVDAAAYPDALARALEEAAAGAVGLKTVIAYRGGFGLGPTRPSTREVVDAAGRWLAKHGAPRLEDPVLLRHGIWTGAELARDRGLPLQIHAGYGDPDLTMHLVNPSLLTDLVRALGQLKVDVLFLHCYPYHREAAYLAAVFPHVYFDVGLALHYTGPAAAQVLTEAMELAPFTKQLYSSDGFALAEFHYLGALLFRRSLTAILDSWVRRDECSAADADRIADLLGRANAHRIYPIGDG
ncbi:MAG TPA: amidohydrolase family protein [Actinomycetota bacterium]|nr:amidohydrolase family protein [Actinomycetota bacterium]